MFCEYKLYIPDGARVCQEHLENNNWAELPQNCHVTHDFNAAQFGDICDMLRNAVQRGSRLDFNTRGALSDEEMHFWTGRNNEQFDTILEQTPSLVQRCRNPRTALSIFLIKLRTGDPNERLATLFNMTRQNLERLMNKARDCLTEDYVVLHLGVDHITRNNIKERNLIIPRAIYGQPKLQSNINMRRNIYLYT